MGCFDFEDEEESNLQTFGFFSIPYFESMKEYLIFYPSHNYSIILNKYKKIYAKF